MRADFGNDGGVKVGDRLGFVFAVAVFGEEVVGRWDAGAVVFGGVAPGFVALVDAVEELAEFEIGEGDGEGSRLLRGRWFLWIHVGATTWPGTGRGARILNRAGDLLPVRHWQFRQGCAGIKVRSEDLRSTPRRCRLDGSAQHRLSRR